MINNQNPILHFIESTKMSNPIFNNINSFSIRIISDKNVQINKTMLTPRPVDEKTFLTFWVILGPYRWLYIVKYGPFRCFLQKILTPPIFDHF